MHDRDALSNLRTLEKTTQILQQKLAQAEAICLELSSAEPETQKRLTQLLKEAQEAQTALGKPLTALNQAIQQPSDCPPANIEPIADEAKNAETLFKQLFEPSIDAILLLEDGVFIDCNQATVTMMRCENKGDFLSRHPSQLSPDFQPDGQSSFEKANDMMAISISQGSHRFEWMHRRLDGEDFWVEVLLTVIEMNGRQLLHTTWREIGDRKTAEAELREQAQLLRSTYEGVEHCIVIIDVLSEDELRFMGWNSATERLTGIDSAAIVGKTPEELLGNPQGTIVRQNYQRCLHSGESITYEECLPFQNREMWWLTTLNPLKDEQGRVYRIVLTTFEITDRKLAELALTKNEAYHRNLLEQASIGLALCKMDGQLVYANSAYCAIVGRMQAEITNLTYWELTPEKYAAAEQQQLHSLETTGRYGPYEKEYIHQQGHLVPVRLSGIIVERHGERFIWSSIEDISDRKAAENALQKTNTLLTSVMETIPGFFFVKDLEGRHIALNSNLADFFGKSIMEVIGKTDADLFPEEIAAAIMQKDQEIIAKGIAQNFEEIVPKKGINHTYLTVKTALYDADGSVIGVIGVAQDISDRKAMEMSLRHSEQRFRDVTEAAGEYIWEITPDGVYTFVTERVKAVKGYNPSELLGHTLFEFMPPSDIPYAQAIIVTAAKRKSVFQLEHRGVSPSGAIVWEAVRGIPVLNNQGEIIGFRGTGLSITERKLAEAALAASEAKFRRLVEDADDLIYEIGPDGTFTYISPQFTAMWGYEVADFLHQPFATLVHPDDLPNVLAASQKLFATGEKQTGLEFRLQHQDSTWTWITCNNSPIKDATGQVIGFQGIARDVSDRKAAETALQQKAQELEAALQELQRTQLQMIQHEKMSSLGQLVAGVAHEINNPISFIYGNITPADQYTQDLLHLIGLYQTHYPNPLPIIQNTIDAVDLEFLKTDLPKTLSSMKMGAERICQIVSSLRTFSRVDETGCKQIDIHTGIDSTLVILEHRLKATSKRPAIQVIRQYGELPLVECYPGQLNQVFMNILANALDALEERDRHRSLDAIQRSPSTITIRTQLINPDRIAIHIVDNGTGIPDTIKQRIFDPFFTTKSVGQGTGMGMSISHQIVTEKHGGTLQCFSRPGQETQFVIEIPRRQCSYEKNLRS
ncbi:MAG: PAS domain S-box protein [Leptolyngbya sp. SIO1D8]|nr:PAS domain S-box protein [Leptolyngbya sp. SIO1D8]